MKQFSFVLLFAVLLAGCSSFLKSGDGSGVQAIVGAKLDRGDGSPAIEHSVVVIANGKFRAVGTQAGVPVPKGAEITQGLGKILEGPAIEEGKPASLHVRDAATGSIEMTMLDGVWAK